MTRVLTACLVSGMGGKTNSRSLVLQLVSRPPSTRTRSGRVCHVHIPSSLVAANRRNRPIWVDAATAMNIEHRDSTQAMKSVQPILVLVLLDTTAI